MRFIEFKNRFKDFQVISLQDIRKMNPRFDPRRLSELQAKGYIVKAKNGFYYFSDKIIDETFIFYLSNRILAPSYISLQSALSFYHFIPEAVFTVSSITTHKPITYKTAAGSINYRNIKPGLFFGYQLYQNKELTIRIAEPEKAVLDFLYFFKPENADDIESIRFDKEAINQSINLSRIN